VDGKRFFTITSDYVFGHDLLKAAKAFFAANNAELIGDELVPTEATDFSANILKIRQAQPDIVCLNLGGNQVTNFLKQYAEFGLSIPTVGFNLNTADAWAAGMGNFGGVWPTVWFDTIDTSGTQQFVADYKAAYSGEVPENHAWIEYIAGKILAQAFEAVGGTDNEAIIDYFESEVEFDILKNRPAYFRKFDHQLIQEAYSFSVKSEGTYTSVYDMLETCWSSARWCRLRMWPWSRSIRRIPAPASCNGRWSNGPAKGGFRRARYRDELMQLFFLFEQIVNGLVLAGYYLLIALGLSMIFSVGGIVNLAHGGFYALGAYLAVTLTPKLGFVPAVVASPLLIALLGILFERFILQRFYREDPILSLLVTFGLAMVAEQAIRMIWGASPLSQVLPSFLKGGVEIGPLLFSKYRLIMLGVVIALLASIWLLLNRTSFGRVIRAGIQNPDMVGALGIRLQPYMTTVVMIGVGLAAVGGALFSPITTVHPAMGSEILTIAFIVVIIGGLGSFWGVVLSAILVGVVRSVTVQYVPAAADASMYILMFLVLLLRPRGLLGERMVKFES